jgi:N utilization substance protein A
VPDNQLSLAIGREGQNARLAAKLTGWRIDIKSESQVREQEAAKLFVDLSPEELAQYQSPTDPGEPKPAEVGEGSSGPGSQG